MRFVRAVRAALTAGAVVGAVLVAAPPASADIVLTIPVSPYTIWYQAANNQIGSTGFPAGDHITSNTAIAPGATPDGAVTPDALAYAWRGINGNLIITGAHGNVDTGVPMAAGTNPSLITFPDGNWQAVVHGADGQIQYAASTGSIADPLGAVMAPGTSPAAATVPDRVDNEVWAWQGANGHLWVKSWHRGILDTGHVMAPGTSPAISRLHDRPLNDPYNMFLGWQGSNGHFWWQLDDSAPTDSGVAMAPGASPSRAASFLDLGDFAFPTAFQASNGHLFVFGAGDDTGLPMKAGTTPSLMITPVDEPGKPLGGRAAYVGYISDTGIVSLYGFNRTNFTHFARSTGITAAPGTGAAIASWLNIFDHSTVVTPGAQVAGPAIAGGTAPLPPLPAAPTTNPDVAPSVTSDTCAEVLAHAKDYVARGIKRVACETTPSHTATPSLTPNALPTACGINQWVITRTEECNLNSVHPWVLIDPESHAVTGTMTYLVSQDIRMSTTSGKITESLTFAYTASTGTAANLPSTLQFAVGCGSPCGLTTFPPNTFVLPIGQSKTFNLEYQDNPGSGPPDTFSTDYSFTTTVPGATPAINDDHWKSPAPIRCDDNTPGFTTNPGCVVPSYTPTLELPLSVYGAGALNAYVGSLYLPGTPGLTPSTPLTRGDPANTTANRNLTCSGFQTLPAGNSYGVVSDSCDEYPFASSQQSAGAIGLAGSNCLEVVHFQDKNGNWTFTPLNRYTNLYPQLCLRGHVNLTQNTNVGTQALNPLYLNNRMMIGDKFTVQVTR